MNNNKIVPCIWLTADGGKLSKVIEYYKTVFDKNFQAGRIMTLGQTPGGSTETCEIEIFERKYSLMSTEDEHHPLNDAVSLMLNCEDQKKLTIFGTISHGTERNHNVVGVWTNVDFAGKYFQKPWRIDEKTKFF